MNSAKKQTEQPDMHLRIIGAHVEATAENTPSKWTFDRAIIRTSDNKALPLHKIIDRLTLKPLWVIGSTIGLKKPHLHVWRNIANEHPSKRHMYDKHRDVWRVSNPSWAEMDRPPMLRGIDLQHPELW